jgi:hypothetical protein
MAGPQAQPDAMPILKLRFDEVVVVETPGSLSPSNVVSAGGQFWLRIEIGAEGMLWPVFNLMNWNIQHFATDLTAGGAAAPLPGAPVVLGGAFPFPPGVWSILTGPFALPQGNYRILTRIRLDPAMPMPLRTQIGGSSDDLLLEVIP